MSKIYTKNSWTDEVLTEAALHEITDPAGDPIPGSVTDLTTAIVAINSLLDILATGSKISLLTDVAVAGTALTAARMNNIEDGVDALDTLLDGGTGWSRVQSTWTYASPTTINVPAGATTLYSVGMKSRFKQGGGYKQYYIVSVADTLLTVTGGSDFTVANAAITDIYVSNAVHPIGFPEYHNWIPTFTGFSADPTSIIYRFWIIHSLLFFNIYIGVNGTSNDTVFTISAPIASAISATGHNGFAVDNTVLLATATRWMIAAGGTSFALYANCAVAAWTNSGGKRAALGGFYQI